MTGSILSEIPILNESDCKAHKSTRYIVDDVNLSLIPANTISDTAALVTSHKGGWQSRLQDCASCHVLSNDVVFTIRAKVYDPNVISISILPISSHQSCKIQCVELDMTRVRSLNSLLPIHVFLQSNSIHPVVKLYKILLLDNLGNIIEICLKCDSLTPVSVKKYILMDSLQYFPNLIPHPGYSLRAPQVSFLSSSKVLLAVSQNLLCWNLNNGQVKKWSEGKCLHSNKRRRTLGGILKSAGVLLTGRNEEDAFGDDETEEVYDEADDSMMSTAAMTIMHHALPSHENQDMEEEYDEDYDKIDDILDKIPKAVCSLHSDGTIRIWQLSASNRKCMYPLRCHVVYDPTNQTDTNAFPPSHMWSPMQNSVCLASTLYNNRKDKEGTENGKHFVLAVCIRTVDNVVVDNSIKSPCNLTLFHGRLDALINPSTSIQSTHISSTSSLCHTSQVEVPLESTSLAAIQFCSTVDENWELHTLYNSSIQTLLTVHKSSSIENTTKPIKWSCLQTLDKSLEEEKEIWRYQCHAILQRNIDTSLQLDNCMSSEMFAKELGKVDEIYMRQLFCPSTTRALGSLRPSNNILHAALQKCLPSFVNPLEYSMNANIDNKSLISMEVKTLLAVRNWAKLDEASIVMDTRKRKKKKVTKNKNTHRLTPSLGEDNSSTSVYHDFTFHTKKEIQDDMETMQEDENMGNEDIISNTEKVGNNEMDDTMKNLERRLSCHHERWANLLLTVLEEEAKLLKPLSLVAAPLCAQDKINGFHPSVKTILVRSGVTSYLFSSKESQLSTKNDELDMLALSLLDYIRNDDQTHRALGKLKLVELEMHVWELTSKAKLLLTGGQQLLQKISKLGSTAIFASESRLNVEKTLQSMSKEEIDNWLASPLPSPAVSQRMCSAPGLFLDQHSCQNFIQMNKTEDQDIQYIPSHGSGLTRQYVDTIRKLNLARCLLICGTNTIFDDDVSESLARRVEQKHVCKAIRMYLYANAVMWVNAQSDTSRNYPKGEKILTLQMRTHLDKSSDARLLNPNVNSFPENITLLDTQLVQLEKAFLGASTPTSTTLPIIGVAQNFLLKVFGNIDERLTISNSIESNVVPIGAKDKKRLSLRILVPFVLYPPHNSDQELLHSQKEMIAECLLAEVSAGVQNKNLTKNQIEEIQKVASNLLFKKTLSLDGASVDNLKIIFESLTAVPNGSDRQHTIRTMKQSNNPELATFLQSLVEPTSSTLQKDVKKLSELQTMTTLFLPWLEFAQTVSLDVLPTILSYVSESASQAHEQLYQFILVLLEISNLMQRVATLESHCLSLRNLTLDTEIKRISTKLILSAIKDTIDVIQQKLPPIMYEENMVEYQTLWSATFRHAIIGHCWDDAFHSCLHHPLKNQRLKNLRRLVIAMADAGELGRLISLIPSTIMNGPNHKCVTIEGCLEEKADDKTNEQFCHHTDDSGEIDLYETFAEAIADAACVQSHHEISEHEIITLDENTNYKGCLYALHAARGDWRRCCQAMDFYGILSHEQLSKILNNSEDNSSSLLLPQMSRDDIKIVDEFCLSSLAAAQVIKLVSNVDHQFIVSGELGPYPVPSPYQDKFCFLNDEVGLSLKKKICKLERSCNFFLMSSSNFDEQKTGNMSRHLRLLTAKDLSMSARRIMALRTMFMDTLSLKSLQSMIKSSFLQLIDSLSSLGYYHHGIALSYGKRLKQQGACQGGRDSVADTLGFMLCNYLAPAATRSTCPIPYNVSLEEKEWKHNVNKEDHYESLESRPTFNQLRQASSTAIGESLLCSVQNTWRSHSQNINKAKGDASMELLRLYTNTFSNVKNSLATEVCSALLDLDSGRSHLPLWLTTLLLGKGDFSKRNGVFTNVSSSLLSPLLSSDPPALIRLYLKRGLYVQACEIVSSLLHGIGNDRQIRAPFRLPEKGNIDFVPYESIDLLWNLIEDVVIDPKCDEERKSNLLDVRTKMENALKQHFELMKISEVGLLSARALKI